MKPIRLNLAAFTALALFSLNASSMAVEVPEGLRGYWSLDLDNGLPAWLKLGEEQGQGSTMVRMRVHVGPEGPYEIDSVTDGRVQFHLKGGKKSKIRSKVTVGLSEGALDGVIVRTEPDGKVVERISFTGTKAPPMPSTPDLSAVTFGQPRSLFNGVDLTGWQPHEEEKINGWGVRDGLLSNATPKTDFSATGDHANLRTTDTFEDFWLHIEFLIEADRNSGVYLRGMYEAQVVDRDSRMQGIQGVGAVFGLVEPSENAGRPPGEWQTYDLILVDRHMTVILNGVKVVDNQPVPTPTGGAVFTDPMAPGPIHLQGDHTAVKYRHIYLAPVLGTSH